MSDQGPPGATPPPPGQQPNPQQPQLALTRHEKRTFTAQTVHLAGNAFVDCVFDGCTLVLTNAPWFSQNTQFRRCNWRIDYDVLWGAPESRSNLRRVLDLIDGALDARS
ncbi:MAG: hypothetical protein KF724_06145 [Phycisphaeraceae bacterium]|nr:hypothetical protein [Phycisphaeraceae bacterium]